MFCDKSNNAMISIGMYEWNNITETFKVLIEGIFLFWLSMYSRIIL